MWLQKFFKHFFILKNCSNSAYVHSPFALSTIILHSFCPFGSPPSILSSYSFRAFPQPVCVLFLFVFCSFHEFNTGPPPTICLKWPPPHYYPPPARPKIVQNNNKDRIIYVRPSSPGADQPLRNPKILSHTTCCAEHCPLALSLRLLLQILVPIPPSLLWFFFFKCFVCCTKFVFVTMNFSKTGN